MAKPLRQLIIDWLDDNYHFGEAAQKIPEVKSITVAWVAMSAFSVARCPLPANFPPGNRRSRSMAAAGITFPGPMIEAQQAVLEAGVDVAGMDAAGFGRRQRRPGLPERRQQLVQRLRIAGGKGVAQPIGGEAPGHGIGAGEHGQQV